MIVCCLVDGERSVSEIEGTVGLAQPRLSQQLAILREAGIIVGRRNAKAIIYRIVDDRAERLIAVMHELFCTAPGHLADAEDLA